jgi:hypothetical protein
MALPEPWPEYDREIRRIRDGLDLPVAWVAYPGDDDEPLVQLSVRLSPRLRHDVAQLAARQGTSVTAVVTDALEGAVRVGTDPFAALAARMTRELRTDLGRAVESGAYAAAAAEVDRAEGWDVDS